MCAYTYVLIYMYPYMCILKSQPYSLGWAEM